MKFLVQRFSMSHKYLSVCCASDETLLRFKRRLRHHRGLLVLSELRPVPPLAQPIEASLAKPDLNAPTSVSISASVIGVENTHAPELMMMQPSL